MARKSSPLTSLEGKKCPRGFLSFLLRLGVRRKSPAGGSGEVPAKALAYLESVSAGDRDPERLRDVGMMDI